METNPENRWVADRLASLEPKWSPDIARARAALDARMEPRRSWRGWATAAATAAMIIAIAAIPEARAVAQNIWYRLSLNRVEVLRVDLSRSPLHSEITSNGIEEVLDIDRAGQKAGFRPHLPTPSLVAGPPQISVTGPISVKQTIRVRDLEAALEKAGARDVQVPPAWEGVTLQAEIGPIVSIGYPGEIQILQARPVELSVPAGFHLEGLVEAVLRTVGVQWRQARIMAQKFATHPAWFLDIPADEPVSLQEVQLRSGRGLLVEDFDDRGSVERVTILFSTVDRMYSISSGSRDMSMKLANGMP